VYLCILPLHDLCFNIFIFSIYFYTFICVVSIFVILLHEIFSHIECASYHV
jgi:hypothetical protein